MNPTINVADRGAMPEPKRNAVRGGWDSAVPHPPARPEPGGCLRPVCVLLGGLLMLGALGVAAGVFNSPPSEPLSPLQMSRSDLAGTWSNSTEGSLVLRSDGTYSARQLCGSAENSSGRWNLASDTWSGGTGISLTADDVSELDATGPSQAPVLWSYFGNPDSTDVCRLHHRGSAH